MKVIYTLMKYIKFIRLFVSPALLPLHLNSFLFISLPSYLPLLFSVGAAVSTVVLLETQAAQPAAPNYINRTGSSVGILSG